MMWVWVLGSGAEQRGLPLARYQGVLNLRHTAYQAERPNKQRAQGEGNILLTP